MKKRRKFTSDFKSKVALEALREQEPLHEIVSVTVSTPTQVTEWKKALLSNASSVFESAKDKHDESQAEAQRGSFIQADRPAPSWRWIF